MKTPKPQLWLLIESADHKCETTMFRAAARLMKCLLRSFGFRLVEIRNGKDGPAR
jgi:beta-galactosidase/beta-glucuronidase